MNNLLGATVKTLFSNKWVEVRERVTERGSYTYSHSIWCDGLGVAVLPYKVEDGNLLLLGRREICPCHSDEFELCSITGGMDVEGESPAFTAKRELLEEGGYNAPVEKFVYLGEVRPSKQSDNIQHLFVVNVTGLEQGEIVGDGTFGEEGAYVEWITVRQLSESQDPLLHSMFMKATEILYNSKIGM